MCVPTSQSTCCYFSLFQPSLARLPFFLTIKDTAQTSCPRIPARTVGTAGTSKAGAVATEPTTAESRAARTRTRLFRAHSRRRARPLVAPVVVLLVLAATMRPRRRLGNPPPLPSSLRSRVCSRRMHRPETVTSSQICEEGGFHWARATCSRGCWLRGAQGMGTRGPVVGYAGSYWDLRSRASY